VYGLLDWNNWNLFVLQNVNIKMFTLESNSMDLEQLFSQYKEENHSRFVIFNILDSIEPVHIKLK
jgi:hypothetical protein